MNSFTKHAVYLFVIYNTASGIFAQQSAEDGTIGASTPAQKIQTDQKKSEEAAAPASDATVGGAHVWQAPHLVGDARDMRYGWVYQVNDAPHTGSEYSYQGVPQHIWHRKLDDHVKSFAPSYRDLNQDSVAFNEIDSNAGYKSMEAMNLAMPKYADTPALQIGYKSEAMPNRDMSHMAIIADARKMTSKTTAENIRTDTTQNTGHVEQTMPKSTDTTNDKVQMQTIPAVRQEAQAPLLDTSGFIQAAAWSPCGGSVAYAPEQVSQAFYPQQMIQSEYAVQQQTPMFQDGRTRMPTFEQQQVVQQQPMLTPNQQSALLDQTRIQSPSFERQQVMQQQQATQQSSHFDGKGIQMTSFEQQRVMQQQQPMFTTNEQTSHVDQVKTQNTPLDQQSVMQERPMLTPAQQTTFVDQMRTQAPSSFEKQQVKQQQQPMFTPSQQKPFYNTKESQINAFEQQRVMQQQPMLAPTQQPMGLRQMGAQTSSYDNQQPMLALDKQMSSFGQQQQMLAQGQQMDSSQQSHVGQQSQLYDSDQKIIQQQPGFLHPNLQVPQQQQYTVQQMASSTNLKQSQQMLNQAPQQSRLMAGQQIPALDQQSIVQQQRVMDQQLASQQMWAQSFEQRQAAPQQQLLMPGQELRDSDQMKNLQQASMLRTSTNQHPATNQQSVTVASEQMATPQQESLAFQQRGGLLAQQQSWERQMQPQMDTTSKALLQSESDASFTGTDDRALSIPIDQVKLDEMRAALSETPEVGTHHKFRKLHGGTHNLYIAVPSVYGGYAGGYRSTAYLSPVYASPSYSTYGSILLGKNPIAEEHSTVVRSADDKELKAKESESGSESAKGITHTTSLNCPQTSLPTSLSMAEEDTMIAAGSESYPVEMHRRGCNCNSVEHFYHDDHDYHNDHDEHVAAVPVEIHPDGRLDSLLEKFQIVLNRSKRGVFWSPNYVREINEAVNDVVSLDPVDKCDSIATKARHGRFTPTSSPYVEYNPNQYLPVREVDLSGKDHRHTDSPNILSGLVQQTEQSIREAIAKATRSHGQVQVMSDPDSSAATRYVTDSNPQPQIISLDEYLKHSQANVNELPVKVNLNQPRSSHPAYPHSYPDHSPAANIPRRSSASYDSSHLQVWQRPTDLINHPLRIILQSIETRLASCCESCKTEVLNDIAEKLRSTADDTKDALAKCKRPKTTTKKVELIASDEDSDRLEDSNERTSLHGHAKLTEYRKSLLRRGGDSFRSHGKRYKGKETDLEANADDEDEDSEEPLRYKQKVKNTPPQKHTINDGSFEDADKRERDTADLASLKRMKDLTKLIQKLKSLQTVRESSEMHDEHDGKIKTSKDISTGEKKVSALKSSKSVQRKTRKRPQQKTGNHRISPDFVGSTVLTPKMLQPYAGFWDPRGLLGRLLKPIEDLYSQPSSPTMGVAYVPLRRAHRPRPRSGSYVPTAASSSSYSSYASPIDRSHNDVVALPRRGALTRPQSTSRPRTAAPVRTTPLVGATRKPPTSSASPAAAASAEEIVGDSQSLDGSSSAVEGCIKRCLRNI